MNPENLSAIILLLNLLLTYTPYNKVTCHSQSEITCGQRVVKIVMVLFSSWQ